MNIIALERGEWAQDMPEEAFRKYKKERPKLGGIFRGQSHFFSQDQLPLQSASSPSLQTGDSKQSTHTRIPSLNTSSPSLSSAPSSPRGSMKAAAVVVANEKSNEKDEKAEKAEKSDKKAKTGKKSKSSEKKDSKKEKDLRNSKDGKDKEKSSKATSATSSSNSGSRTERKWAVFKRSTENRQRLADE